MKSNAQASPAGQLFRTSARLASGAGRPRSPATPGGALGVQATARRTAFRRRVAAARAALDGAVHAAPRPAVPPPPPATVDAAPSAADSPPGRRTPQLGTQPARAANGGVDGLLLVRQEALEDYDLCYLTGFTGTSAFAVVTRERCLFLTDARYREQAAQQCPEWEVTMHARPATAALAPALQAAGVRRLGFEPAGLTVALLEELRSGLPEVELQPLAGAVTALRSRKDAAEIAAIARAGAVSDAAFAQLLPRVRPGRSERALARELEELLHRGGAEELAFPSIVAAGPNSALPHARPSDRRLQRGDLVIFDFGARVDGYCADITRTVVLGPASTAQRKLYGAVLETQTAALAALRPGANCGAIAEAAQQAVAAAGYGDYPSHSLGHGLGLAIHEGPVLRAGNEEVLAAGHVVTVEPGVYIPGFGGVRIEDTVVVEEQGRVLTATPKALAELEAW